MVWFVIIAGILSLFGGIGIFAALGYTAELAAWVMGTPLTAIIQACHGALYKEVWLAIPLFILAGYLMLESGATRELVDLINAFLGRMRAGLALVAIVTCGFFGACSGSILSAVAAIGTIMIPMMADQGYDKRFSAALISVAAVLAMLIPPSNIFIIYCGVTATPIGHQFLAGIIPGFLLMALLYIAVLLSPARKIRGTRVFIGKEKLSALYHALPILGMPVVILGGIYGGICTAVEAAAAACWYVTLIGFLVYRRLNVKGVVNALRATVKLTSIIFMLVIMAYGITAIFTILRVPTGMANIAMGLGQIGFLLVVTLIMLFLGLFLEAVAAMVVIVPVMWAAVLAFGLSPLYFGVIICTGAAIGYSTPPVCLNLYTAASVSGLLPMEVAREIPRFLIAIILACIICLFFPILSTFLPGLVYG